MKYICAHVCTNKSLFRRNQTSVEVEEKRGLMRLDILVHTDQVIVKLSHSWIVLIFLVSLC